jgi:hypothetical protein
MDIQEYLDHPAVSRSELMVIDRSPKHYWWQYISDKSEQISSEHLEFGRAFHTLVLEPQLMSEAIAVIPDGKRRPTKAQLNAKNPSDSTVLQIEWWERFDEENEGKAIIKEDKLEDMLAMAEVIRSDPAASEILKTVELNEEVFFFGHNGRKFKVRIDGLGGAAIDIKTTKDASERSFANSIVSYGYDVQAYMIMEALRQNGKSVDSFVIVAQEKEAPYAVSCYEIGSTFLETGKAKFERLAALLKKCTESRTWPSYFEGRHVIEAPEWYEDKELDNEIITEGF